MYVGVGGFVYILGIILINNDIAFIHIESLLPLDDNNICTGVLCIFWESYS